MTLIPTTWRQIVAQPSLRNVTALLHIGVGLLVIALTPGVMFLYVSELSVSVLWIAVRAVLMLVGGAALVLTGHVISSVYMERTFDSGTDAVALRYILPLGWIVGLGLIGLGGSTDSLPLLL